MIEYLSIPEIDKAIWGYEGSGWYFWDETQATAHGPYNCEASAEQALNEYAAWLNMSSSP